jgi:hypothetical protein
VVGCGAKRVAAARDTFVIAVGFQLISRASRASSLHRSRKSVIGGCRTLG